MKIKMIVKRNLAVFLNNKAVIFLTFASICVVVSLYVLFLRNFSLDVVEAGGVKKEYISLFTDRMMISALFPVISTTTSFGILHIYVRDTETGIKRDFLTTPVSPFTLTVSCWISSAVVSVFFSLITLILSEIYFRYEYANALEPATLLKLLITVTFSSVICSGIVLIFANLLKTVGAFLTFANLYGTLAGFLSGSYLPYSFYPKWLKDVLFFYPPFQLANLCRQFSLENIKEESFSHQSVISNEFFKNMGILLQWDNKNVSLNSQIIIILLFLAVLIAVFFLFDTKEWICTRLKKVTNSKNFETCSD